MVVTGWLLTLLTAVWQERTASPPTITVQAPQSPTPQPYLGPLMFNTSRSTHRRGISGGTSTVAVTLLTVNLVSIGLLHDLDSRGFARISVWLWILSSVDLAPSGNLAMPLPSRIMNIHRPEDFRMRRLAVNKEPPRTSDWKRADS